MAVMLRTGLVSVMVLFLVCGCQPEDWAEQYGPNAAFYADDDDDDDEGEEEEVIEPDGPADDDYAILLTLSPLHAHPGDVMTFLFSVDLDEAPVEGLLPDASYAQTEGGSAAGAINLSDGEEPGTYSGLRALTTAGFYEISFSFEDETGGWVERVFLIELESHD